MGATESKSFALYLHIPFCRRKCPYCDFYSVTEVISEDRYLSALERELELWLEVLPAEAEFVTFYAGGGTPSLCSPKFYGKLFEKLSRRLKFRPKELTLEANPEGLSLQRLKEYASAGFNRISVGVQSLTERGLRILGRLHGVKQAVSAVQWATDAGFETVSVDLIYAWPTQTLKELERELELVLALRPHHISCYELTYEKGTPLEKALREGRLKPLSEDEVITMFDLIRESLSSYEHYEVSNYASLGRRCLHNLFYWKAKPYLGLGASASSFFCRRRWKNPDLKTYLTKLEEGVLPAFLEEELDEEAALREAVVLGLRLLEGVDLEELKRRFGVDPSFSFKDEVRRLKALGLLEEHGSRIRVTDKGLLLLSQVQMAFL